MKGNSSIIIINRDLCEEWLGVLKECGIGTIGLHSLYQYGGIDEFLNWLNRADVRNLLQKFKNAGIEIEYQLHAVNWLLPRGLFSVHPEWFRTDKNGVRVSDWNLCVSSAEALEYIENSAYLLAKMLEHRKRLLLRKMFKNKRSRPEYDYYETCFKRFETLR